MKPSLNQSSLFAFGASSTSNQAFKAAPFTLVKTEQVPNTTPIQKQQPQTIELEKYNRLVANEKQHWLNTDRTIQDKDNPIVYWIEYTIRMCTDRKPRVMIGVNCMQDEEEAEEDNNNRRTTPNWLFTCDVLKQYLILFDVPPAESTNPAIGFLPNRNTKLLSNVDPSRLLTIWHSCLIVSQSSDTTSENDNMTTTELQHIHLLSFVVEFITTQCNWQILASDEKIRRLWIQPLIHQLVQTFALYNNLSHQNDQKAFEEAPFINVMNSLLYSYNWIVHQTRVCNVVDSNEHPLQVNSIAVQLLDRLLHTVVDSDTPSLHGFTRMNVETFLDFANQIVFHLTTNYAGVSIESLWCLLRSELIIYKKAQQATNESAQGRIVSRKILQEIPHLVHLICLVQSQKQSTDTEICHRSISDVIVQTVDVLLDITARYMQSIDGWEKIMEAKEQEQQENEESTDNLETQCIQWTQKLISLLTCLNLALQQIAPTCNPLWEKENSKRVEKLLTVHYNHCYSVLYDNKQLLSLGTDMTAAQLELMNHWKVVEKEMVLLFKHFYRPRLHDKLEHYNWNGLIHNASFRSHFLQYFRDLHLNSHPLEQIEVFERIQKTNPQFFYHLLPYVVRFPTIASSLSSSLSSSFNTPLDANETNESEIVEAFHMIVVKFFQKEEPSKTLPTPNATHTASTHLPWETVQQIWIHQSLPLINASAVTDSYSMLCSRFAQYMQLQDLLVNTAASLLSPWSQFLPRLLQSSILKTCQSLLTTKFDNHNSLLLLQSWLHLRIFKDNTTSTFDADDTSKHFLLLYNDYVQDPNAYLTMFALGYKLSYWAAQQ